MLTPYGSKDQVVAILIDFDIGHDGPFAICKVIGDYKFFPNSLPVDTSVTFHLRYWKDTEITSRGSHVILGNLSTKPGGWRAFEARLFRPSDQQPAIQQTANSNEQGQDFEKS